MKERNERRLSFLAKRILEVEVVLVLLLISLSRLLREQRIYLLRRKRFLTPGVVLKSIHTFNLMGDF